MQSKPIFWVTGVLIVLIIGLAAFSFYKPGAGLYAVGSGDQGTTTSTSTGSTSGSTTGSTTHPTTVPEDQYGINMPTLIAKMANNLYQNEKFYLVDNSLILVVRTGNAADASYSHVLMDKNLNQLCILSESIAGPHEVCADQSKKAEFDIMTANLDKANLGLSGHTVVVLYQTRTNPQ